MEIKYPGSYAVRKTEDPTDYDALLDLIIIATLSFLYTICDICRADLSQRFQLDPLAQIWKNSSPRGFIFNIPFNKLRGKA